MKKKELNQNTRLELVKIDERLGKGVIAKESIKIDKEIV